MSLALTLFSMIAAWMAVALAMVWGMLRIARRRTPGRYEASRGTPSHPRPTPARGFRPSQATG